MAKRKLEELNLLDDFLFGTMLTYPGIGEAFARELLKIIMDRDFGSLTIIPQRIYYGTDTDKHGARLDVYVEETAERRDATIYDIEPEKNKEQEMIAALPKRVRFYHAKIDAGSLKSGEDYQCLKNVTVVMITPYDPFGKDRMIYTIQNQCAEMPDFPYNDGSKTIFLYTKGTQGSPPEAVHSLLQYMEKTTEENAVNCELKRIHRMVETVKQDREVSIEYMKIFEREQMLIRQGIQQGREEEQGNTEKERQRADKEAKRAELAEKELQKAYAEIEKLKERQSLKKI